MSRESAESMNEEVITESEFQEAENRASEKRLESSSVSIEAGGDPMLDDPQRRRSRKIRRSLEYVDQPPIGKKENHWTVATSADRDWCSATCYSDEAWSKRVGGVSSHTLVGFVEFSNASDPSTKLTQGFTGHTFWQPAIGTMPKCGLKVPRRPMERFGNAGISLENFG